MKINSIEIENFRNIEKLKLNFEDVNIIWGENAQGKTNLIEAIYLFTGSKSFRGVRDKELVEFKKESAKLKIDFENKSRKQNAELIIKGRRTAKLNKFFIPYPTKTFTSGKKINCFNQIRFALCIFAPNYVYIFKIEF
jgi:DNA replication and repair protein RecF